MPNSLTGFGDFADDLRDFADSTGEARRRLGPAINEAGGEGAESVSDQSQRDVAVDTGELKNSGEVFQREDGVWVIRYTADHSVVVEEGSDPHIIEPNDADALRFETDSGEVVYTMRVRHPGTEAQPYLGPAVDAEREKLPNRLLGAVEATFAEVFR